MPSEVLRASISWKDGDNSLVWIFLSSEFIEDEIDNEKNKDYLEKVAMKVVKNHLNDMLKLAPRAVIANLGYWFREAKQEVDEEKNVLVKSE